VSGSARHWNSPVLFPYLLVRGFLCRLPRLFEARRETLPRSRVPRLSCSLLLCSVAGGVPPELVALETWPLHFCCVIWVFVYCGFLVLQILLLSKPPCQIKIWLRWGMQKNVRRFCREKSPKAGCPAACTA